MLRPQLHSYGTDTATNQPIASLLTTLLVPNARHQPRRPCVILPLRKRSLISPTLPHLPPCPLIAHPLPIMERVKLSSLAVSFPLPTNHDMTVIRFSRRT